ncbi:MAG: HEAT repeat domain-containing protein [Planctomycetota bacterium]|nr:HEAT repeat domain-containing protein [Planctomycetota bacterium]
MNSGIPKVLHPEDYPLLVAVLTDPTDDDTARNEVANLLQRSKYPGLADALCKVLDNPEEKPRFRSFAAQHLGLLAASDDAAQGEKAVAKLHACLADRDVPVRREALLALVRKKDPQAIEAAVAWLTAPPPSPLPPGAREPETGNQKPETVVVDLAIRCVYELGLREHIPTIRKYARDPNDVVRIAAIVALSQWGDEESRPAFEEAAQSKTVRLQRAGKAALERLDHAKKAGD